MPRVLLRLCQSLLVLAVFCLASGTDFVAQGVAWSTMMIDYSRADSVMEAMKKTFDGQHPCALCKKVEQNQSGERKQNFDTALQKVHLCCVTPEELDLRITSVLSFPETASIVPWRAISPPLPPPRAA